MGKKKEGEEESRGFEPAAVHIKLPNDVEQTCQWWVVSGREGRRKLGKRREASSLPLSISSCRMIWE